MSPVQAHGPDALPELRQPKASQSTPTRQREERWKVLSSVRTGMRSCTTGLNLAEDCIQILGDMMEVFLSSGSELVGATMILLLTTRFSRHMTSLRAAYFSDHEITKRFTYLCD